MEDGMKVAGIVNDLFCEFTLVNRSERSLHVRDQHTSHGSWDWKGGNQPIQPGSTKRYVAKDQDFVAYGSEGTVTFVDDAGSTFSIKYCCSYGKGGNYCVLTEGSALLDVTLRFANATPPENAQKTWGSDAPPLSGHPLGILIYVEQRQPVTNLKVLTYNTHLFAGSNAAAVQPSLVQKDQERRAEILKKVIDTGADVVCLQEIWSLDFQHQISRDFAKTYPYFYIAPDNTIKTEWWEDWLNWVLPVLLAGVTGGWSMYAMIGNIIAAGQGFSSLTEMLRNSLSNTSGLLLVSRYPLADMRYTMYKGLSGDEKLAKKGLISFTVKLAAAKDKAMYVRMGMTHCPTDIDEALRVIGTVASPQVLQDDGGDRLLIGDFNLHMTNADEYNALNKIVNGAKDITVQYLPNLDDAYTDWQAGNSLTWLLDDKGGAAAAPTRGKDRIDYIYHSAGSNREHYLEPKGVSVFHNWDMAHQFTAFGKRFDTLSLSDHYPVLADFKVARREVKPWKTIRISGGVSGGRSFLSVPESGASVDLWNRNDGSGRQLWRLVPCADGSSYNIIVKGGVSGQRKYLSARADGGKLDLHDVDDASGRQRWVLSGPNILIKGGVPVGHEYLSVTTNGEVVDLYGLDDRSGRQRWIIEEVRTIALQASNGNYVCAEGGGGQGVTANRNAIGPWETFRLVELGGGKVAIEAPNGLYLGAEGGGGGPIVANRAAVGPWETLTLKDLGGNKVALQAANGQYVCAEGGGGQGLVVNRSKVGPWETFTLLRS